MSVDRMSGVTPADATSPLRTCGRRCGWPRATGRPRRRTAIGCVVAHGFTGSSRNADVRAHLPRPGRPRPRRAGARLPRARTLRRPRHGRGRRDPRRRRRGAWLRAPGYARVAVLGWSMGGTAVLRYAGLGGDADAVVSVSAPGAVVRARHPADAGRPLDVRDAAPAAATPADLRRTRVVAGRVGDGAGGAGRGRRSDRATAAAHRARRGRPLLPPAATSRRSPLPRRPPRCGSSRAWGTPRWRRPHELVERIGDWVLAGARTRPSTSATMASVTEAETVERQRPVVETDASTSCDHGAVVAVAAGVGLIAGPPGRRVPALLVAVASCRRCLAFAWVFGTQVPGRTGALVLAALAAGGADTAVSVWPHGRLGSAAGRARVSRCRRCSSTS